MPANLGMIAFGKVKQLEKRLIKLEEIVDGIREHSKTFGKDNELIQAIGDNEQSLKKEVK